MENEKSVTYRVKSGFILREVDGVGVVVPVGPASLSFHGMLTLNQTGILLWKHLTQGASVEELTQAVTEVYEIEKEAAQKDVVHFLEKARAASLLEE